ncbi:MAG: BACON domain-containing protein [Ardenticatenaceae bacterium]|nr:BACON domain-containing protein [Ardenticatenaceae bacterium]
MKHLYKVRLLWLLLLLPFLYTTTAMAGATADQSDLQSGNNPTIMVSKEAHYYTLAAPRIIWRTLSDCSEPPSLTPSAPQDPELIRRVFTTGGLIRTLLEKNDPRLPQECNPYHIHSNLVADGSYVYWADDSGLVRQSVFANATDEPELMSAAIKSTYNNSKVELAETNDYIYALIYATPISGQIWRINKNNFAATPSYGILGYGAKLSADEQYVYWTFSGTLFRAQYQSGTGWTSASIATNVTSYASEGLRTTCTTTCVNTHYVFIAKNHQMVRYNNLNGGTSSPIYTSTSPDAPNIYNIISDGSHVFFLESRQYLPCPGCFFEYTQVLFRIGRSGGTAAPLYTEISPLTTLNVFQLETDGEYIYWQEDDTVQKLPNDVTALPQTNITINRMEVTQAIQNINNSVPLIAGRRTFVRVFAQADGVYVPNVTAFLYRVNPLTLQPIGEPLAPVNTTGTHLIVFTQPLPQMLDGSFIFELPLSWVQSNAPLKLKVVVNPYNSPLESNPNDNTAYSPTISPLPSSRLEVEFFSFIYTDSNNLTHSPHHTKDIDQTFSWIRRTYPLASAPGGGNDSSPGFRPNVHWVVFNRLTGLLMRTDSYCDDFSAKEKSSCAATFVNDMLRGWQSNDEDADGTAYIYYGLMQDDAGFGRGRGGDGVASGPAGAPGSGSWDTDGAYTDWYSAHELGHAIGRSHPSQGNWCGHTDDDDDFPYFDSAIGPYFGGDIEMGMMWGFDGGDPSLALPKQPLPSAIWRDVMGYCDYQWVSDYTYMGLYADIPDWQDGTLRISPRVQASGADMLSIYGTLLTEQAVAKMTFIQRSSLNSTPVITPGDFSLRLLNAQNQVLANHPFTPEMAEEGSTLRSFGLAVPFVNGTTHLQIVETGTNTVWADEPVSANAPVVNNVAVVSGSNPVTGTVTVNWTAVDADNDPLTFDILFSQDGGSTFSPYVMGVEGSSTPVDTNFLGGGSTIFRVVASDGVNSGSADSAPFTVANKPPMPSIHNPGDGAVVTWGQLINFMGEAADYQDGTVDPANLVWSNQYGELGTGAVLDITDLPVGVNQITLTATNSKGLSASKTITVIVQDDLQPPAASLQIGPNPIGWHVAVGETAVHTTTVHFANMGLGNLTWTASEDADWLTMSSYNGSAPEEITFMADPTGLNANKSYAAHVTITASNGQGSTQEITLPVTLSIGNVWDNPAGYTFIYLPVIRR